MGKVVSIGKLAELVKSFKKQHRKIVLVGGCFDILHPGHVIFLQKAKKTGDILIVLLESDEKVRVLKGKDRPVLTQNERAIVLSALEQVDHVVMLPFMKSDTEYDDLVERIKPDVIAVTAKDTNIHHHQRSAKKFGAKLESVTEMIGNYSTTHILNH